MAGVEVEVAFHPFHMEHDREMVPLKGTWSKPGPPERRAVPCSLVGEEKVISGCGLFGELP